MAKTKYSTKHSVWIIDDDAKVVTRMPRGGEGAGADHRQLPYDLIGRPMPYEELTIVGPEGWQNLHITFADLPSATSGTILEQETL